LAARRRSSAFRPSFLRQPLILLPGLGDTAHVFDRFALKLTQQPSRFGNHSPRLWSIERAAAGACKLFCRSAPSEGEQQVVSPSEVRTIISRMREQDLINKVKLWGYSIGLVVFVATVVWKVVSR
jgi:pimeloyl-ACP methyl ester carboxylesterase